MKFRSADCHDILKFFVRGLDTDQLKIQIDAECDRRLTDCRNERASHSSKKDAIL